MIEFQARGRPFQVVLSAAIAAVRALCYALLIVLYVAPERLRIDSLLRPDAGTIIKPAAVVGLLATILAASAVTLVTRCVEHSLWLRLGPDGSGLDGKVPVPLTVGEVRRLAQWSTSTAGVTRAVPFARDRARRGSCASSWSRALPTPTVPLLRGSTRARG